MISFSPLALGQIEVNADSLFQVWEDKKGEDSIRLKALTQFISNLQGAKYIDSAIHLSTTLTETAASMNQPYFQGMGLNLIAISYWFKRDFEEAATYYKNCIPFFIESGNLKWEGNTYFNLALLYKSNFFQKYDSAYHYAAKALQLHSKEYEKSPFNVLVDKNLLTKISYNLEYQDSLAVIDLVLPLNTTPGSHLSEYQLAMFYFELTRLFEELSFPDSAIEIGNRALELKGKLTKRNLGSLYKAISDAHYFKKNTSLSIEYRDSTIYYERLNNDYYQLMNSLYTQGDILIDIGLYDKALIYFFEMLTVSTQQNYTYQILKALNAIGNVFFLTKENEKAIEWYNKCLELANEYDSYLMMGYVYSNLANIYRRQGNLEKQLEYAQEGVKYQLMLQDYAQGVARAQATLGLCFLDQEQFFKADSLFFLALTLRKTLNNPTLMAASYRDLCESYFSQKKFQLCINYAMKLLSIATEYDLLPDQQRATYWLYSAYEVLGNYKDTFKYYREYSAVTNELNDDENQRDAIKQEFQYEYDQKVWTDSLAQLGEEKQKALELATARASAHQQRQNTQYLLVAMVLIVSFGVFFYRVRQNRLEKIHQITLLNSELKALRAQFNPHFLFNAMASIQQFVLNNDRIMANQYLTRFARLMRLILQNSDELIISLEEEFKTLKYYLEIEQLRVGKHFEFNIAIAPDIEGHNVEVPSMLLQIFAENAIWHGIAPKETGGTLSVIAGSSPKGIVIALEDDGIGREAAGKNNPRPNHKSKGMQMTEDKITLFNQQRQNPLTLEIIDLYDDDKKPNGTRVEILIPQE